MGDVATTDPRSTLCTVPCGSGVGRFLDLCHLDWFELTQIHGYLEGTSSSSRWLKVGFRTGSD